MRYPMVPRLRETSTRRLELELLVEPTTSTSPALWATLRTATWRFSVA